MTLSLDISLGLIIQTVFVIGLGLYIHKSINAHMINLELKVNALWKFFTENMERRARQ